jgi:hypothetical protein
MTLKRGIPLLRKTNFARDFNPVSCVTPHCAKISLYEKQKMCFDAPILAHKRDATRSSRVSGADAMDVKVFSAGKPRVDEEIFADGQAVWS